MRRRVLLGLAALALGLAACTAGSPAPDSEGSNGAAAGATAGELVGGVDPAAREQAVAAAEDFDPFAHTDSDTPPWPWELAARGVDVPAMVPLDELRSGGPPPDGIPPIDDPQFESVAAADEWLTDRDPVLLVEHGNAVRAYPLAILTFHEVVNDVVAGDPLLVTYCPLCNSALAFERTLDGEVVEFGTSGRLWRSNLVMYDRATRSLWLQFTGEAIVGARVGDQLERLPLQMAAWGDVAQRWPDAEVLSRDTGHDRPYGENPYVGYDEGGSPMLFGDDTGGPLEQMQRVVATGGDADPVAYPLEVLRQQRVIHDEVDGQRAVVLWAPGTASALDSRDLAAGDDVGTSGVFRPRADGRALTFEPAGEKRVTDQETGSTWTVLGEAVDGPLQGARLTRLTHDDTFWFVQHAFRPDTRVVQP
jgi:hypothetical protein